MATIKDTHWVVADDWGLSPGVNEGILALARKGIVRGVAIMVRSSHVEDGLGELMALPGVNLGLHFVWSDEIYDLGDLVRRWNTCFGKKKRDWLGEVQKRFEAQLKEMKERVGRVEFVNGHHHVHVLPGVPRVISEVMVKHDVRRVRLPSHWDLWFGSKALLNLWSFNARRAFKHAGISYDPFYYPGPSDWADPEKFRRKLLSIPRSEIIVHPAARDDFGFLGIQDPYRAERVQEFNILQKVFSA